MADHVCQNVQPATMRHPHCDLLDAQIAGAINQLVEECDDGFASFDREALLAQKFGIQKPLKLFGGNELPENALLNFRVDRIGMHELAANLLAQPKLLFLALNVTILGADLAAVGALENVEDLSQGRSFRPAEAARDEYSIQIPNRQSVGFDVEFGMIKQRHRMQRIDVRRQMATHAIRIN